MNERNEDKLITQWLKSIDEFIIHDIRQCLKNDFLGTGLIILTLAGVECISGYFCGKKADKQTFCEFLSSEYFPQPYATYSSQIYEKLRNGLVHDHTNKNNIFCMFRNEKDSSHLKEELNEEGERFITFNRETFAKDFINAWEILSKKVIDEPMGAQNVRKRIGDRNRRFLIVKDISLRNQETDKLRKYHGGTIGYSEAKADNENCGH